MKPLYKLKGHKIMGDNTYGYDDCPECDGQGQIERYQRDPTSAPIWYDCQDCGGSGEVPTEEDE